MAKAAESFHIEEYGFCGTSREERAGEMNTILKRKDSIVLSIMMAAAQTLRINTGGYKYNQGKPSRT